MKAKLTDVLYGYGVEFERHFGTLRLVGRGPSTIDERDMFDMFYVTKGYKPLFFDMYNGIVVVARSVWYMSEEEDDVDQWIASGHYIVSEENGDWSAHAASLRYFRNSLARSAEVIGIV